jgi:L-lactate dehydrogenase complex protein LldG
VTARDVILGRIRAALADRPAAPELARGERTTSHLDPAATVDRFAARVDDYRATVHRCTPDQLATTLASILAPSRRVAAPAGLPAAWLTELAPDVEVLRDHGQLDTATLDTVDAVVTGAAVGIAETGTIGLDAGDDQGRRALTLVPDLHVCVIRTGQIVATVPEAFARLDPIRPLTFVSGPSATSDIELDRVEGVHGPRTLHVVLVARA